MCYTLLQPKSICILLLLPPASLHLQHQTNFYKPLRSNIPSNWNIWQLAIILNAQTMWKTIQLEGSMKNLDTDQCLSTREETFFFLHAVSFRLILHGGRCGKPRLTWSCSKPILHWEVGISQTQGLSRDSNNHFLVVQAICKVLWQGLFFYFKLDIFHGNEQEFRGISRKLTNVKVVLSERNINFSNKTCLMVTNSNICHSRDMK